MSNAKRRRTEEVIRFSRQPRDRPVDDLRSINGRPVPRGLNRNMVDAVTEITRRAVVTFLPRTVSERGKDMLDSFVLLWPLLCLCTYWKRTKSKGLRE